MGGGRYGCRLQPGDQCGRRQHRHITAAHAGRGVRFGHRVFRRDELLDLAATMFAERGLRATTVRDIADSAGILSGSLYHHFSSKEEMVDELLRGFLDWLFERYQEIAATEPNPLERLKGLFMASFEAIEDRHAQVVIYQDEAKRLSGQERFSSALKTRMTRGNSLARHWKRCRA